MGDNADEYKLGSPGEPVNARTTERFSLTAVTSAKSLRPWTEDQKWDGKASGKKSWIEGVTRDLRDYPESMADGSEVRWLPAGLHHRERRGNVAQRQH